MTIQLTNLFMWVLSTSTMASVLVLFIFLAKLLLKDKLKPRWSYLLWSLLVLRLLLPWTPESSFSVFNILSLEKYAATNELSDIFEPNEPAAANSLVTAVQLPDSALHIDNDNKSDSPVNKSVEYPESISMMQILSLVWLSGAVSLLGFIFVTNIRLAAKLNREPSIEDQKIRAVFEQCRHELKIKRSIGLFETSHVSSPTLFGTFRPKILLPRSIMNTLDVSQIRHVFLHEMSHIKRNDIAMNWLMNTLLTLHWFNPLLWYAYRKMRDDQEIACDSLALTRINPEERKDYALTIIRLLESFSNPIRLAGAASISSNKYELKRRVFMITTFTKNSNKLSILGLIVMLLISGCALTEAKAKVNSQDDVSEIRKVTATQLSQITKNMTNEEVVKALGNSKDIGSGRYIFRYEYEKGEFLDINFGHYDEIISEQNFEAIQNMLNSGVVVANNIIFTENDAIAMVLKALTKGPGTRPTVDFPNKSGQTKKVEATIGGKYGTTTNLELTTQVDKKEDGTFDVTLTKNWNVKVGNKNAISYWKYEVNKEGRVKLLKSEDNDKLIAIIK